MNEEDWLEGAHPLDMLDHVVRKVSARKVRLFAAACCRALGRPEAADACERVADGLADLSALVGVPGGLHPQMGNRNTWTVNPARVSPDRQASHVAWAALQGDPVEAARGAALHAFPQLQRRLIELLREVVGNPFRSVRLDPSWLLASDRLAPRLAQGIYEERAFDRLPILADALEEAGCTETDLLDHCRSAEEHVRGCWAVDLLRGWS